MLRMVVPLVMPVPVLVRVHFGRGGVGGQSGDEDRKEAGCEAKADEQAEVHG